MTCAARGTTYPHVCGLSPGPGSPTATPATVKGVTMTFFWTVVISFIGVMAIILFFYLADAIADKRRRGVKK